MKKYSCIARFKTCVWKTNIGEFEQTARDPGNANVNVIVKSYVCVCVSRVAGCLLKLAIAAGHKREGTLKGRVKRNVCHG